MTPFFRKLTWLGRRTRKEAELLDELQFHLEEETEARTAEGLSLDEARGAARRDLGNLTIVREDTRAAWTWTLLEQLAQDLRYGFRMLVANKVFSGLAVLSLALGIGANAAIFSFMDAMLLRSLPVSDPQSLVTLAWRTKTQGMHGTDRHEDSYADANGFVGGIFAYPAFELLRQNTSVFEAVFGYQGTRELHLEVNGRADIAKGEYVSGNYFTALGVSAASGRLFEAADDRTGAAAVVVISYETSLARFGGPAAATGQSILLNHIPFTIVGITPPEFFGVDPNVLPAVYVPLHAIVLLEADDKYPPAGRFADPAFDWVIPMARLRPGVSAAQAQAAVGPAYMEWKASTDAKLAKADLPTLIVKESAGGLDSLRRAYSKPLYVLLGLVGLILAIACANIANLLLARAAARTREMAVRLSIGAGRQRVIRQLMTESLLLSGIGGALGVVFAIWGVQFLTVLLSNGRANEPYALAVTVNWRVLGVAAALSMLTGLVFGVAPAIQSTRLDLTPALKAARVRGSHAHRERRLSLSRTLVVAQVAFTLLILVTAGLFLRTLSNLESIDVGFNREQVLAVTVNARQAGHRDPEILTFYDRLRSEFAAIPGVRSATLSDSALLGNGWSATGVKTSAAPPKSSSAVLTVGPDFFATMQLSLLRGRGIDARDRVGAPYVAVVNEAFARKYFGDADPIGRHVTLPRRCATCDVEIVGLSANARYGRLREAPPATIFLSLDQGVWGPVGEVTYQLRTAGIPLGAAQAVRTIVERADPRVPLAHVTTQRALVSSMFNQEEMFARLCTAFAVLALTIACVGLYGTLSYGVARRTSEIGVRIALGARRATVVWMVLREVLAMASIALAISVPVALAASKLVESFLFGMTRNDPAAFAAAAVTLTVAMLWAGYIPARSASRIDPIAALRHE